MLAEMTRRNYIICRNITDVFRAEKILTGAKVEPKLVPAPPAEAGPCTTAIAILEVNQDKAVKALEKAGIKIIKLIRANTESPGLKTFIERNSSEGAFSKALLNVLRDAPPAPVDMKVLLAADGENQKILWTAADQVRADSVGDVVDIRSALEFSNYCRQNCSYCGLRRDNRTLARYRMDEEEILNRALEISRVGIRTLILQSGEDPWYTTTRIVRVIKRIRQETGMRITLSLGEREPWEYEVFREAGASNYLLKVETTSPTLYSENHSGKSVEERIDHVRRIKQAGFITGSGNIIGLPGQDLDSLAKDIVWFWEEGIHMIGIGPFVPAPNTPLETFSQGSVNLTLNTIAVTRMVCKNSYIPSTTALATVDKGAQTKGLACGANTVMLISTPASYRDKYQIYGHKKVVDLEWALAMISELSRKVPTNILEKVEVNE